MLRDVNRDPRRWVDASGRVRVVEGWHPSDPREMGYNLIVDGDWVGTFVALEDAVKLAGVRVGGRHKLALQQQPGLRQLGDAPTRAALRIVPPVSVNN